MSPPALVVSYTTVSPLPARRWRSTFCCTCPRVTPGGRYPPSCPVESGLSSTLACRGRPTDSPRSVYASGPAARAASVRLAGDAGGTTRSSASRHRPWDRRLETPSGGMCEALLVPGVEETRVRAAAKRIDPARPCPRTWTRGSSQYGWDEPLRRSVSSGRRSVVSVRFCVTLRSLSSHELRFSLDSQWWFPRLWSFSDLSF